MTKKGPLGYQPGEIDAQLVLAFLAIPTIVFYEYLGHAVFAIEAMLAFACAIPACGMLNQANRSRGAGKTYICAACAVCAFALTTLGGEGRLVPATTDWLIRDAVLNDLVKQNWPYLYSFDGRNWELRAPLGMFLTPALVGKTFGEYSAFVALWFQNTLGFYLVFRIFTKSFSTSRSLTILLVFGLFSGWDVPGALLIAWIEMKFDHIAFSLPQDIGWWAGPVQYSSTITLSYWVPNHALAGWFVTALLLLWETRQVRLAGLLIGAGISFAWSPFALIGAMPFLIKSSLEALFSGRVNLIDVVAIVICGSAMLPLSLFLISDIANIPSNFQTATPVFIFQSVLFLLAELLPFILLNFFFGKECDGFSRVTYRIAIVFLVVLPFYHFGAGNDLMMRASIPSLAIFAITTGNTVYEIFRNKRPLGMAAAGIVLGLSSLTGVDQTWHVLSKKNLGISSCDFIAAWDQDPDSTPSKTSYLALETNTPPITRPVNPFIYVPAKASNSCAELQINRQFHVP